MRMKKASFFYLISIDFIYSNWSLKKTMKKKKVKKNVSNKFFTNLVPLISFLLIHYQEVKLILRDLFNILFSA